MSDTQATFEFRKGEVAALKGVLARLDEITSDVVIEEDEEDVLPL